MKKREYLTHLNDIMIEDALISKNDELWPLQEKYNVLISRSIESSAVYIARNKNKYILRIGHYMNEQQFKRFSNTYRNVDFDNVIYNKPTYQIVEKYIKKFEYKF